MTGADAEILKGCGALCWPPSLGDIENFRFEMIYKGQNNVRNYKFLAKYFYKYFQNVSIFTYNDRWPMKSYQFFKIYKSFEKKREKNKKGHIAVNEKRKTEKS